jgi:hypothetical protein
MDLQKPRYSAILAIGIVYLRSVFVTNRVPRFENQSAYLMNVHHAHSSRQVIL